MTEYIIPVEAVIVALAAISGFFIKKWMDRSEIGWREQMDSFAKRQDVRLDKIEGKLDSLMSGRIEFVPRLELSSTVERFHARMDELNAQIMELSSRVGVIEGIRHSGE
jgi:hypothetical protein